jgi:cytochrome P450
MMTEQVATRETPVDVDELMMSPQFVDDRYAVYDVIRAQGRLLWVDGMLPRWVVTGHHEMQEILRRHDKFSSDRTLWDGWQDFGREEAGSLMIAMDPPEHTRVRQPAQQALTPRGVREFQPQVEVLVDEMLTEASAGGEFDLMHDFADRLPLRVLGLMLGVPREAEDALANYIKLALMHLDVVSHTFRDGQDEVKEARGKVEAYLSELIEQRRRQPQHDLISRIVAAEDASDRLSPAELQELCLGLTSAGLEPTTFSVGNTVNAMFQHPEETARLRADPGLLDSAIEEFLRYDAPAHLAGRVVKEDVEIDGQQLRRGQLVAWLIGAANRDPHEFPEPNRLNLSRKPNHHMTFGYGAHRCVGAPVARMLLSVVIPALMTRFPKLRPAGAPARHPNPHVYAFSSFPVAID